MSLQEADLQPLGLSQGHVNQAASAVRITAEGDADVTLQPLQLVW